MKNVMMILVLVFAGAAHALPGSYGIKCDSVKGAKQVIHIDADAADIEGKDSGFPSSAEVIYGKQAFKDANDDGTLENLVLINRALDGVIDLKYRSDKFNFEVWGLPATIRLKKHSDEYNGGATFRAHAISYADGPGYLESTLDCVLSYSGGSAG